MLKIYRYLKKYKKEVILGPLFKIIEAIFELIVPLVMARIIDIGIVLGDSKYIIKMGLILLLLAAIGLSSTLVCQYFASRASQGYGTVLRNELFRHINTFSYAELDKFETPTLINRMTADVNQLQVSVAMLIRLVIRAPFLAIGASIMALIISPKIAIIFVISAILVAAALYFVMSKSIPFLKRTQRELDNVSLITKENLSGVRVIRAFSKENDEIKRFETANDTLMDSSVKAAKISMLLNPITYIIINIAVIAILYFGSFKVDEGVLTQGEIIALINYMMQILLALIVVANLVIIFTRASASANRINEIFETKTTIKDNNALKREVNLDIPIIEFANVSFAYGRNKNVLSDVSFKINHYETIGIIGITGSGKSTVANLICRFYDPNNGIVKINGQDVKDFTQEDLRKLIGMVLQKPALFSGTIRENMQMRKSDATDEEILTALKIAQAEDFVLEKSLDYHILQGGKNLSGGQRQRIAIARSLIGNSKIIIFDDSSSALDYATDLALRRSIKERLSQKTVLLISQRISTIKHADRIIVLNDGKIVGNDNHEALLQKCEKYKEIYKSQNREV